MRREFGRVTYWLQTLRSYRRWAHRKPTHSKDLMQKRWYFPKKMEKVALILLENQKGLFWRLTAPIGMLVKREMTSGLCQEISHPRLKLYSWRDESFRSHWNTLTFPELLIRIWMSSKRSALIFFWKFDEWRDFHGSWTGFTQYNLLEETPPDGDMWSGEWLRRKQLTPRLDYFCPELWTKWRRNAKLEKTLQWSFENAEVDNARKNHEEFISLSLRTRNLKRPSRMLARNWKTPVAPAMPCKISKDSQNWVTRGKSNEMKAKFACISEFRESEKLRKGEYRFIRKRRQFIAAFNFSYASSHEDTSSKSSSEHVKTKLQSTISRDAEVWTIGYRRELTITE